MSEYWKSTPKYWCKHCSIFVRDTKLERQNHEATGKHQGALKRFLRDLHRGHEQEEREKERAKREVERLKGIAPGSSASSFSAPSYSRPGSSAPPTSTEAQRKQQMEQLAEMGVSIPTEFRGDMALAGEWTVTATKVIDEDAQKEKPVEAKAIGIRKREQTEEEREEEEAVRGLFKRPKKWGSTKTMPEDDKDLDALLSSSTLLRPVKKEEPVETDVKTEESPAEGEVKKEEGAEDVAPEANSDVPAIKREPTDEDAGKGLDVPALGDDAVKKEDGAEAADSTEAAAPAVVFKKRKPKNIRQK
ncbi:U1 zinc finger domain-containing protein [Colletotrichum tofieldiae]|uniref:U1 zinc finger domain-containing protein n=1 Tax=Colletotrichum tofieldiae TaxID=708197 RepID=A0A166UR62_9PEZI|nr:U1 zinc finger domain-containing protein [Colletotrichum tofieldiae]GKT59926.1 U1 zinc finger domain-containing protein [Colletotrichum tofieldiae]GKT67643.1 U1 zinc finger domain-containing protein [Colletotrichum tofieldiae]